MTGRPSPPNGAEFDALVASTPEQEIPHPPRRRGTGMLGLGALTLALIGAAAIAAAVLVPHGGEPAAVPDVVPTTAVPVRDDADRPALTEALPASGIAALADPAWVARMAREAGIPERALAAYAGAAIDTASTDPSCRIGWNTLAAIGMVESEHGSMNGASLTAAGDVAPAIIGIPLDGNGTLAVPDTDAGVLDGDTRWDRAVGPMQFIPATWNEYGRDGNGDGRIDVNNLDDASLAAAHYLCAAGGDLSVAANWISAVAAYNPSVPYNNRVAEAATHYAALR